MKDKILFTGTVFFAILIGFFFGKLQTKNTENLSICSSDSFQETSIVQLQKRQGDQLFLSISGPVRILWGKGALVENDGEYKIPLGQIKGEGDIVFEKFAYVGNEKTHKFYPSDSYPARGTAVQYRRFFQTKQEALEAGFIPMKGMK